MTAAALAARPPRPWWLSWPGLAVALALALAWRGAGGDLHALLGAEARRAFVDFARGFWPPAHSAALLAGVGRALGETAAIALLGMTGAVLLAAPLALLAVGPAVWAACGARPGPGRRLVHRAARLLLSLLRSVPELVWALLFVRAVGVGPAAGVLAIAVAYGGVVGRVFAEILESTPRGPAEALGAAGARPLPALLFGLLPSARPVLASYTLYRLDCSLRASAVLGLVGAGGVGQQVELSLRMLAYDEVASWVLALFALVLAVDLASAFLRRRLARRSSLVAGSRAALARDLAGLAALAAALAAAGRSLDLPVGELLSRRALAGMWDFARTLFPPETSAVLLGRLGPAVAETLAVSVLGTALAAAGGLALALLAARPTAALVDEAGGPLRRLLAPLPSLAARGLLNLGRTLPELLWALAFVFAVGLGPFAGALALAVHTAGVLGRLYVEALEEVPAGPVGALRAAGAGRLGLGLLGVLPQAAPQLLAYTLYRWEVNIRASAVLGVVGAGGLGQLLHVSLSIFDHGTTLTLLGVILALVLAVDALSGWLRRRLPVACAVEARALAE
ncbi:MAG TPA: phosphonate ABC transporter, permease protein PhnE [Anaeromyxobacteraceae bacterium]|nr:phosphonate ABC transporter, permease protein PhnE [Anaeromyxobacteraceae bacterium]